MQIVMLPFLWQPRHSGYNVKAACLFLVSALLFFSVWLVWCYWQFLKFFFISFSILLVFGYTCFIFGHKSQRKWKIKEKKQAKYYWKQTVFHVSIFIVFLSVKYSHTHYSRRWSQFLRIFCSLSDFKNR